MTKPKKPAKRVKAGTSREAAEQKRLAFVEAYLANNGNASQAAIAAGYSAKTCGVTGAKMLKDPRVKLILEQRTAAVFDNLKITTERILLERARLAFFDPRKLFDKDGKPIQIHELDDDTAAALAGLDVMEEYAGSGEERVFIGYTKKYKLADKNASLTSLEKQRGMYKADNEQKKDPITELLQMVAGAGFKPVK